MENLEQCVLCKGMHKEEIEKAFQNIPYQIKKYEKGQTVFAAMEKAEETGIILSGAVQMEKIFPNGKEMSVIVRKAGQMIGPAAVFSREGRYPCTADAIEASSILMIRKDAFLQLLHVPKINENFINIFADAVYILQERIELLSYDGISQKAAFWLLLQMHKTGNACITIPGSMSQWALHMNVSRPSLYRELKKMQGNGWITVNGLQITIKDAEALQGIL